MSSEARPETPKKKHHHGWWITLLVIALVLGVAVGGFYYFFYDDSAPTFPDAKPETDFTTLVKRKAVDAFATTKTTGQLDFSVHQDEANQLLANLREKELDEQAKGYVRGALVDFQGSNISLNFYLNTQVLDFKTKIHGTAKLKETDDAFSFQVDQLRLGSASFLSGFAKQTLQKYLPQSAIDATLADTGFQITFDASTLTATYPKAAMEEDIEQWFATSESQDSRYAPLLQAVLQQDNIHLSTQEDALGFVLSLENAHTNEDLVSPEKETAAAEPNFIADAKKMNPLFVNQVLDDNLLHASYVYQLLGVGYNNLSDEAKDYVDTLDLSSIGIADAKSESGHSYASSYDLATNLSSSLASLLGGNAFVLSENDLSAILQSSGLLGYGVLLPAQQEDESWKTAWIGVNATYINIFDRRMVINLGIDVAGYECYFIVDSVVNDEKSAALPYGLVLDTENVYTGKQKTEEAVAKNIFALISTALASKNISWLTMNAETGEITIDISKAIPTLSSSGVSGLDIALKGNDLASEGKMEISLA